jgi:hypothetical protein
VFFIAQTLVFKHMGDQGLPYKGDPKLPDDNPLKSPQIFTFSQDIPNYLAMAFVGFIPCRHRL